MKKKIFWMLISCLMVLSLVMSSCGPAEEGEERKEVVGEVNEKEGAEVEEEEEVVEEGAVVEEEEREMVLDPATGEMVEKPRYGGTITQAFTADPYAWDPWRDLDGGQSNQMGMVFEVLMVGDWSTPRSECEFKLSYVPAKYCTGRMLESWSNPDPLTYIIKIREGMHFWDKPPVNGREVTADDVKWSVDRMLGQGEFAEVGPSPYVAYSYGWEAVEAVEVIDKYTFIFHMSEARALFPEAWGMERMPFIIPHEVVDEYGNDFSWEHVVGSGPWQIVDFVSGSQVTYERFPNYYGWDEKFPDNQIPYADTVQHLIILEESTQLAALRTGKLSLMYVSLDNAKQLWETSPQLKWTQRPDVCVAALIRNDLKPYNDIRVRKAMQMAINLKEMAEVLYGGEADPFPMVINSAFKDVCTPLEELPEECQEGFNYNPERARELLAEAGYPNGFSQTFTMSSAATSFYTEAYDLFAAYWEDIGIETTEQVMESAAASSFIQGMQQEVMMLYSCATWMPLAKLDQLCGGQKRISWNYANVDEPEFNQMIDTAIKEPDPEERTRMVKEANAYGTCRFWEIKGPSRYSYVFWQPWLKSYNGEVTLDAWWSWAQLARVWVDQDLKYEMTGSR